MPRNPELEKLLREVDTITQEPQAEERAAGQSPSKAEAGSSFMKSVVGLFIVQDEEAAAQVGAAGGGPPPVSIEEIAEALPSPSFQVTADDMARKGFPEIYAEAGLDESIFTVDKLNGLLQDPTLKEQPLSTKALVLKMALKAQDVAPDVPVEDAIKRDKALDAYQKMLNERAAETEAVNARQIQDINEEVKKFLEAKNAEMDALRNATAEMKRQAEAFAGRRAAEEKRLAEIIIPLLDGKPNPVSEGN